MDLCKTSSTRKPNHLLFDEIEPRGRASAAVESTSPQLQPPMKKVIDTYRPRRLRTPYPILRTKDLKSMLGAEAPIPAAAFQHVDSALRRLQTNTLGAVNVAEYSTRRKPLPLARPVSSDSDLCVRSFALQAVDTEGEPSTPPFHLRPLASQPPLFPDSALAVRRWQNLLRKKSSSGGHRKDDCEYPSTIHRDVSLSSHNDAFDWFAGFHAVLSATLRTASATSPARESSDALPLPSPASHDARSYMTEDEYKTMVSGEVESIERINEQLDAMIERSKKLLDEGKHALSQEVEIHSHEFDFSHASKSEAMVMSDIDRLHKLDPEEDFTAIDPFRTPVRKSEEAAGKLPERDADGLLSLEDSRLGSPFFIIRATPPESLSPEELQIRSKRLSGKSLRHTGRLTVPQANDLENPNLVISSPASLAPLLAPVPPLSPLSLPFPLFGPSISEFGSSDEEDFSAALVQAVLASKYDIRAPIEAVFYAMGQRTKAIFDIAFLTDNDGDAARHAMLLIKRSLREWARMHKGGAEQDTGAN